MASLASKRQTDGTPSGGTSEKAMPAMVTTNPAVALRRRPWRDGGGEEVEERDEVRHHCHIHQQLVAGPQVFAEEHGEQEDGAGGGLAQNRDVRPSSSEGVGARRPRAGNGPVLWRTGPGRSPRSRPQAGR